MPMKELSILNGVIKITLSTSSTAPDFFDTITYLNYPDSAMWRHCLSRTRFPASPGNSAMKFSMNLFI